MRDLALTRFLLKSSGSHVRTAFVGELTKRIFQDRYALKLGTIAGALLRCLG